MSDVTTDDEALRLLREALGAELVDAPEFSSPPACRWPGCAEDPAISPDGEVWWCWTHADDEALPPLESGVVGACVYCHTSTTRWWVRWPEEPDLAFHDHCRRPWAMRVAEAAAGGAPVQESVAEVRPIGAFGRLARRRRAG